MLQTADENEPAVAPLRRVFCVSCPDEAETASLAAVRLPALRAGAWLLPGGAAPPSSSLCGRGDPFRAVRRKQTATAGL